MKDYINLFYSMLDKIHEWDSLDIGKKKTILLTFLDNDVEDKKSGEYRLPHHVDLKTGMYRGRQVLDPKE